MGIYALQGHRPVYLERGREVSAICALTMDGVLCVGLTMGTVDGSCMFCALLTRMRAEKYVQTEKKSTVKSPRGFLAVCACSENPHAYCC